MFPLRARKYGFICSLVFRSIYNYISFVIVFSCFATNGFVYTFIYYYNCTDNKLLNNCSYEH